MLVASPKDAEEELWARKIDHKYRSRVHDATKLTRHSLHHLAALVGEVDLVVTPDTGLMHMCGLAGVPTVAVFYSIEPALRIRDFPNVAPFCPEAFRTGPHWGLHKPAPTATGTMKTNEKMLRELARLYTNPECVPGYKETWKQIDVEDILAVEPGERIPSTIRTAPVEDNDACRQPI